jgi:hypothetical protein
MRLTFIAVSFCLLSVTRMASTQTERKVTRLADGVYGVEHAAHGGGNTTVILGERQVFVVDTCFSPSAARETSRRYGSGPTSRSALCSTRTSTTITTFEHGFSVDLGNREVRVQFLGRGSTAGGAVVYLPREKIVAAGDLVVHPIPYI